MKTTPIAHVAHLKTEQLQKMLENTKAEIEKGKAQGLGDKGRIMRTRYGVLGAVSAELAKR